MWKVRRDEEGPIGFNDLSLRTPAAPSTVQRPRLEVQRVNPRNIDARLSETASREGWLDTEGRQQVINSRLAAAGFWRSRRPSHQLAHAARYGARIRKCFRSRDGTASV